MPVRVQEPDGSWVPVDTTLSVRPTGRSAGSRLAECGNSGVPQLTGTRLHPGPAGITSDRVKIDYTANRQRGWQYQGIPSMRRTARDTPSSAPTFWAITLARSCIR